MINSGSSSIKYKLINGETQSALAEGLIERIGESGSRIIHKAYFESRDTLNIEQEDLIPDHGEGMERIIHLLTDTAAGVIDSLSAISAIGHRVVQGGEKFKEPVQINDAVVREIEAQIPLAPLHNPGALAGITTALRLFDAIPQVAVFDTAFHQSIPPKAFRYALPHKYYEENRVRRFGFHGTSHQYVTHRAADLLNRPLCQLNVISLHLGNGSSITAVENGESVDTSMGLTPLDGVIMGTRCGSIDPAIIAHITAEQSMELEDVMHLLTKESGLKGFCGSNDLRDIHQMMAEGNETATLAFDMLIRSYRHFVGAYFAVLPRVDAILFTAGIGENDPAVRKGVCQNLEHLGVLFDDRRNTAIKGNGGIISEANSPVTVMVIPTDEELEIANQTRQITAALPA